jgi:UDP-N-acetylglucosamine--dolichyl-phosphate N-acetylglucosaminephosphotransferase
MLEPLIAALLGLLATYSFIKRVVMRAFPNWGIVGMDVHKPDRPNIPEMGGVAFLVGITVYVVAAALMGVATIELLSIFLTIIVAGAIGIADDVFKLSKRTKPALCALAGLPIVLIGTYPQDLILPLSVSFHIPVLYALLVPVALAVTTNAINMFDVMNGVASGSSLIILLSLVVTWFVKCLLVGGTDAAAIVGGTLMALPPLAVLFYFNRYPSKIFLGDTGTLASGATIGAFAIVYGVEFPAVVAMMVPITNAFFSLFSHGGLFERSELRERPILIEADGRLSSNPSSRAPLTLTKIMLLLGYDREKDVYAGFMHLTLATAAASVLSGTLIWGVRLL